MDKNHVQTDGVVGLASNGIRALFELPQVRLCGTAVDRGAEVCRPLPLRVRVRPVLRGYAGAERRRVYVLGYTLNNRPKLLIFFDPRGERTQKTGRGNPHGLHTESPLLCPAARTDGFSLRVWPHAASVEFGPGTSVPACGIGPIPLRG